MNPKDNPYPDHPSTATRPQIDWNLGESLTGGRVALAATFVRELLQHLGDYQTAIGNYYAAGDWRALEDKAHQLLGASAYSGVPLLQAAVRRLEMAAGAQVHGPVTEPVAEPVAEAFQSFNTCVAALRLEAAQDPRLHRVITQQDHKS